MQARTDLALEQREQFNELPEGVNCNEETSGDIFISTIEITNKQGEKALGKPIGTYITVTVPAFTDNTAREVSIQSVADSLSNLLPSHGSVLIVGLGNRAITPDALGPKTAERILATRKIGKEIARVAGIESVRSVSVITTGVMGQTGVEAADLICGTVNQIKPSAVIVIDALASRYLKRLGTTVQLANSGIEPGAGVGNARREISQKTLGVPVIAIGVPTVVDAATLVFDLTGGSGKIAEPEGRQMIVTPREVDLLIDRAAGLLAAAINRALHPNLDADLITELLA